MAKQKSFFLYPLLIFVFLIALVSGNWSITYADKMDASPLASSSAFPSPQTRSPSTPAAPPVSTFPPPPVGSRCSPATESVGPTIEALLGCYPWVVLVPIGAACSDGIAAVYDLPIVSNPPPYHWKMINYADDFEVRFYSNAQLVKDPPCGNLNVIYYLNHVQRQIYDKTHEEISIYLLDVVTHTWTDCKPNLVSDVGINGVLVCSIKNWGFFALGHPSWQQ